MSDIVERARQANYEHLSLSCQFASTLPDMSDVLRHYAKVFADSADEIERLREARDKFEAKWKILEKRILEHNERMAESMRHDP